MQSLTLLGTRNFGNNPSQSGVGWAAAATKIISVKIQICRKQRSKSESEEGVDLISHSPPFQGQIILISNHSFPITRRTLFLDDEV